MYLDISDENMVFSQKFLLNTQSSFFKGHTLKGTVRFNCRMIRKLNNIFVFNCV